MHKYASYTNICYSYNVLIYLILYLYLIINRISIQPFLKKYPTDKRTKSILPSVGLCQESTRHRVSPSLNVRSACDVTGHFLTRHTEMKLNTQWKMSKHFHLFYAESPAPAQTACDFPRWGYRGSNQWGRSHVYKTETVAPTGWNYYYYYNHHYHYQQFNSGTKLWIKNPQVILTIKKTKVAGGLTHTHTQTGWSDTHLRLHHRHAELMQPSTEALVSDHTQACDPHIHQRRAFDLNVGSANLTGRLSVSKF